MGRYQSAVLLGLAHNDPIASVKSYHRFASNRLVIAKASPTICYSQPKRSPHQIIADSWCKAIALSLGIWFKAAKTLPVKINIHNWLNALRNIGIVAYPSIEFAMTEIADCH
jgi:hypothetical protein